MRTQVGIMGAGPAGLVLSHLLHQRGVDPVVIDPRTRAGIEETIKAGVLEQGRIGTDFFRQYPFAWFGILAEAPRSSDELIYAHSDRGFALISTRSPSVQRLYSTCDPETDPNDWSDDRIWDEPQARVAGAGATIKTGPIFQKAILQSSSARGGIEHV